MIRIEIITEFLYECYVPSREGSPMRERDRQKGTLRKLGYYGTVPLWFQRTDHATFVLFNDLRIAKRGGEGKT
jgi:hypothetical protein